MPFVKTSPKIRYERTAQGKIVIAPPTGYEAAWRGTKILGQLAEWAEKDGRGQAFGPSTEFILPTRAALSPDCGWVSTAQLSKLSKTQLRKFPPLSPEFVIDVMSFRHRLKAAQKKMNDWMAGGLQLGWLIDGDHETVYIYRAGQSEPEKRTGIKSLAGEGPVAGFKLDQTKIWRR